VYAKCRYVVIQVTCCWDWLHFQHDFIVKGHSIPLFCRCALLLCQASILLCRLQVVVLRDVKSCSVEVKKENCWFQLCIYTIMKPYFTPFVSVAKIKYTVKINHVFVLPYNYWN
jgi:hypothetical protein